MSVIPISPVKDRTDEVRQAGEFRNDGGTFADWAFGEAVWFGRTFIRVAASVAFTRWVYGKLFGGGIVSKSVFDRAQDLMHPGRRRRPFTVPPGAAPPPGWRPPGGSSGSAPAGEGTTSNGTASEPTQAARAPEFRSNGNDRARIVGRVGEFVIAHHNERLREDHFWPCPITNHREGCLDCVFFAVREKVAMCAAVEKLRQMLAGQDDGMDLYEMAERLKRG